MTPTWFTPERVAALEYAAEQWRGTPFAGNSCTRGAGVSCHNLAAVLYESAGYQRMVLPDVPISHARFSDVSFVLAFFTSRADFVPIADPDAILPGDVLGFRIGRCVHHLGVALTGRRFAHAIDGAGACIATIDDATWLSRLTNIWRPKP